MPREIVLDTETTGLSPKDGHRIIEIGCLELLNHVPTGRNFHVYINPQRDIPDEAYRVHGISEAFLTDKPIFGDVVDDFLAFIGDAPLIIHNAAFDLGFINAELGWQHRVKLSSDRAIDTVQMARRKFPGAPANLDALCRRFGIDLSARTLHGALKDAELLAEVYLELIGGREPGLSLIRAKTSKPTATVTRQPRIIFPDPDEITSHQALVERLKNPLWIMPSEQPPGSGSEEEPAAPR